MTLQAHLTQHWPIERVLRYGPDITAALHKLAREFPEDVHIPGLMQDLQAGRRQLWLVLDDERDDAFVSFALTTIDPHPYNGRKVVTVTDLAGEGGVRNCPLAAEVEMWARDVVGADEVAIVGRVGWSKALAKEGYTTRAMIYRKPLKEAA